MAITTASTYGGQKPEYCDVLYLPKSLNTITNAPTYKLLYYHLRSRA